MPGADLRLGRAPTVALAGQGLGWWFQGPWPESQPFDSKPIIVLLESLLMWRGGGVDRGQAGPPHAPPPAVRCAVRDTVHPATQLATSFALTLASLMM